MKKLFNLVKGNALSIIAMMVLVGIATWGIMYGPQSKVYDCSLAEFHPDFPVKAREACRELRGEQHGTDK